MADEHILQIFTFVLTFCMVIFVVNTTVGHIWYYGTQLLFGEQFVAESRTKFLKSTVFLDDAERQGERGERGESEEEGEGRVWGGGREGGLRLARGWLEAFDPNSGGTYYFHAVRGDVQWEKPVEEAEGGREREEKGVGVEQEEQQEEGGGEEEEDEEEEEEEGEQAGGFAGDVKRRGMVEGRGLEEEGEARGQGKGTGEVEGLVRVSEAGGRGAAGGGGLSRSRACCIS
jgi:hypothetical protein